MCSECGTSEDASECLVIELRPNSDGGVASDARFDPREGAEFGVGDDVMGEIKTRVVLFHG